MTKNIKIDPYGFREYDARWLYKKDINLAGIENLGKGLGTQIIKHTKKKNPRIVVGHDYRSYSEEIKFALKKGYRTLRKVNLNKIALICLKNLFICKKYKKGKRGTK